MNAGMACLRKYFTPENIAQAMEADMRTLYCRVKRCNGTTGTMMCYAFSIRTVGEEQAEVRSAEEFVAFIAAHPEIESVMFDDSRYPRRGVAPGKITAKYVAKSFKPAKSATFLGIPVRPL